MQPGLVAKGLAATEAETDDLIGGTRAYARRALKVYGVLTALGIIGSLAVGIGFFDAVLYTFAAVSTGGFAPHDGSLAAFGWPAQVWISLLCLAGAIPLAFYYRMLQVVETAMENTMGRPCHQK
jgi:trk system potassium uptake protein TrkH